MSPSDSYIFVVKQEWPGTRGTVHIFEKYILRQLSLKSCLQYNRSIEALANDAVPTVLVAAKCDNAFTSWEVDQEKVESFCNTLDLESFQTSISAPETHKRCISVILRNIMLERRRESPSPTCYLLSSPTALYLFRDPRTAYDSEMLIR